MSGRAGFSDDFHQRVLFNLFNSSLNEDHVLDNPASSQHLQVMKRNATPSDELKSRKRSKVWKEFSPVIESNGKKATCNHCNKEFVSESKKGTSHLLSHLKICPENRRKNGNKPSGNGNLTAHVVSSETFTADVELSSLDLIRSAIKRGGKTFMDDLLHVYRDEKQKLCESFTKLSCRFSLAIHEAGNHVFMTVYYIDENWEMKRNILFLQYSRVRNLEKLRVFPPGLNLDESLHSIVWPNNDVRHEYMNRWGDIPGRVPFGDNFKGLVSLQGYIDCVRVVLVPGIIRNVLGYDLSEKVDKAFMYVKSVLYDNDKHDLWIEIESKLTKKEEDMSYFRTMMCALEYKEAFLELEKRDRGFTSVCLNRNEWEVVAAAYDCLKVLNDVTYSLSRNKYKTANLCIRLTIDIYKALLRLGSNGSNPNSDTQKSASHTRDNFVKGYWERNSLVLSIVAILDPCFKLGLVRDWYNIIYPTEAEAEANILRFANEFRCIYNCYAKVPDNHMPCILRTNYVSFDIPELDSYLGEEPLDHSMENLEILTWWRKFTPRFPTLARMARDFLAVPICEVNSDTKDDITKMDKFNRNNEWLAFEWATFWLQNSHHEVQILENPHPYRGQEITKTRQGNASSNCVNYEMVSHTVRHNTSNTPRPKQTQAKWSKVWNECTLTPKSYYCGNCQRYLTAEERFMHLDCVWQRFFEEDKNLETEEKWKKPLKNLGPFRRSDLTTLVDTKKKFKVDCELDGSDLARMTIKLGHTAFADNLLHVYKEEKQKAAKYLNELSCPISLEVSNPHCHFCKIITVQFIDEVWKLQRKILCLDLDWGREFNCIGISPQELNAGRNLCFVVHFDDPEEIDEETSYIKSLFPDPVFLPCSGNFQVIMSLRYYINEFIPYKGAKTVRQEMEKISGCDIFKKIEGCYEHVHKKFPYNVKSGEKNSIRKWYDHESWGIALEFRETFLKPEDTDLDFKSINLTKKEWDALTAGYAFLEYWLKVFKDVSSEHLSGKEYTTANVCLPLICNIYKRLQGLPLIYGNNDYICQFAPALEKNFVKDYWEQNGLALAIAAVLDPRFKMDVVKEWYNLIYDHEPEVRIQGFIEEFRQCCNCNGNGSELDLYLRAPKHSIYDDFQILTWWRDSTSQFPTLARMARYILAIPVWSDSSAMIDEIERMLCHVQDLDICNAFICTESWLESLKGK